ncbi:hypothetical protein CSPX01_09279 [Colletotrichum filicis]|nr:hypothetical protein CSPX01_09279 [Colletotrichum filicis]
MVFLRTDAVAHTSFGTTERDGRMGVVA